MKFQQIHLRNNFFSFLAAMMLAYQPVRSLATLNVGINQGLSAARRILPIIDIENKIIRKLYIYNLQLIIFLLAGLFTFVSFASSSASLKFPPLSIMALIFALKNDITCNSNYLVQSL